MEKFKRSLVSFLLLTFLVSCLFGCADSAQPGQESETDATEPAPLEIVDYVAELKLDMSSETAKQEVTVKQFVDGDTTHFHVPASISENGVLKARYVAINTPESTGKIEEYGKKASAFTKEKLSAATSIIIESETDSWNVDTTGDRFLVWVWYKTADSGEYRNLNLEILQNGLAIANGTGGTRYGTEGMAAFNQAKLQRLNIHSGQKDPDFYYGEAVELTLKELRTNVQAYDGMKVAFTGVITKNYANTVYLEDYDEETGMYFGISAYCGFSLNGAALDIVEAGNEARIVGTVQYYEAGGTWQVSDLKYRAMKPDDPGNIQMLSQGHTPAYVLTTADTFANGTVTIETEEGSRTESYAALAMNTSVEMKGLTVVDVYTTDDPESSSNGCLTLTCEQESITITVRTVPLQDENGERITGDVFLGKTIDVKGLVDCFDGTYQIKVFTADNLTITE